MCCGLASCAKSRDRKEVMNMDDGATTRCWEMTKCNMLLPTWRWRPPTKQLKYGEGKVQKAHISKTSNQQAIGPWSYEPFMNTTPSPLLHDNTWARKASKIPKLGKTTVGAACSRNTTIHTFQQYMWFKCVCDSVLYITNSLLSISIHWGQHSVKALA